MGRDRGTRETPSALYSRSSKARGSRRRMRGFEGWGRHLRSGPAPAAKSTFALAHRRTLREIITASPHHYRRSLVMQLSRSLQKSGWFRSGPVRPSHPTLVLRRRSAGTGGGRAAAAGRGAYAVPSRRRVRSGQAASKRDDGDLLAPARGDAQGPGSRLLRLRRTAAEDCDGGLNQDQRGREWPAVVIAPRRCVSPELYFRTPGRGRLRADARAGSGGHRRWRQGTRG